jgi:hypothetical protein
MDPRVKTNASDLRLMFDTSRGIDALLGRSAAAIREMRAATNKTPAMGDLEQRLSRASAPLGQLFGAVESADAAPLPPVMDAWSSTRAAVEPLLAEWEKVKAGIK